LRIPSPASNTRPVTSLDSSLANQTTIGATQRIARFISSSVRCLSPFSHSGLGARRNGVSDYSALPEFVGADDREGGDARLGCSLTGLSTFPNNPEAEDVLIKRPLTAEPSRFASCRQWCAAWCEGANVPFKCTLITLSHSCSVIKSCVPAECRRC
jgi:hypothetical protein